ncbi:DICT sensory domain-containing protein [Halogeometricum limi]|uniref:DICT domain-containing protein n=1 Tax=Halogeometricum limi TaxID=555875 RepID=A0A1I6GI52_9EURY|nr:DICT sensory domain-containing protein [Halogeometricum limi]SFR41856.1 DICT domain-containing protein [Halogeometricum limi]
MSLTELITGVEDSEKTLIVHNADDATVESVTERFADRNVTVTTASTADGPPEYAVLSEGDRVLTATSLSEVLPDGGHPRQPEFTSNPYKPILDRLDETMFTSFDPSRMLSASREIEDRAWRAGEGTLYAGFQHYSTLEKQLGTYEQLGTKPELDVTAIAFPDAELSDHDGTFEVYPDRSREIRDVWFVAYDGGGDDDAKCALVAEEREPRRFYGFWTYDPRTVDYIFDYVDDSYLSGRSDRRRMTGC